MALPPALVLCCSKAGLAVARALGAHRVTVTGVWYGHTKLASSSRYVSNSIRSPHPDEDPSAFVDFLVWSARKWAGGVLFPTDDASLLAVSRYKARLTPHYRVVAEQWPVVRRLLEKHSTYELAERLGVPCPRVQQIESMDQAVAFASQVGFPCLIKPSVGHTFFARYNAKMFAVRSVAELQDSLERLAAYRDGLMLSEYIPGDDTSGANYNSLFVGDAPSHEFTARKVRLKPSLIGFPTIVRSSRVPEVLDYGRAMLRSLGFSGFSCTEFKRDSRDGTYKLMEINARHNFSGMLALRCGINFPWLSYLQALGAELPEQRGSWPEDMYWIDEERDFKGLLGSIRGGANTVRGYADPYLKRPVFAVFTSTDPLPSFRQAAETFQTIRRAFSITRAGATNNVNKRIKA